MFSLTPSSLTTLLALGAALSLTPSASACHDIDHQAMIKMKRAAPADEAAAAVSTDVNTECTAYYSPAVAALQQQGVFPPIWEIANLSVALPADTALYQSLAGSIPNIAPRGTPTGNFTGVVYDGTVDPDCWWSYKQCTTPKLAGLQDDVTRCLEPNTWGFTLDDGPNCSHNAYYDYLQTINQKATLFYIGSNILDWPYQAQRGLDDGHEICAHTWSHRYMTSLTNEEVFAELYFSKKAVKEVLGITVQCWRPPYGDVDDRVRYIAQALGMQTVIWEDNTFDYLIASTNLTYVQGNYNAILQKQAQGVYNTAGTIVLSHELNNDTMTISESFLPQIQKQFSNVMPVAVCNNNTKPYVEQNFVYPNFAQYASGTRSIAGLPTASAVSTNVGDMAIPLASATTAAAAPTSAGAAPAATTTGVASVIASNPYANGATGANSGSSSSSSSSSASSTAKSTSAGIRTRGGVQGWEATALGFIVAGIGAGLLGNAVALMA